MSEHSPAPVPTRGVYGFSLYLACSSAFVMYLIWAFVPDQFLHNAGVTYYPQKYWAVALPVYVLMGLALFAFFFYPALNQRLAPPLDSINTFTDTLSPRCPDDGHTEGSSERVPPAYDLDISHVSKMLYMPRKI